MKNVISDSFSLIFSSKKLEELKGTITLKQGLVFTLLILGMCEILKLVTKILLIPSADAYFVAKLLMLFTDALFAIIAAGIGLVVFGYVATALSTNFFNGQADKGKMSGLMGYSAAPFLIIGVLFFLLNTLNFAGFLEVEEIRTATNFMPSLGLIAPVSMSTGGLIMILEAVVLSFKTILSYFYSDISNALLIQLIGLSVLIIAIIGALRSFWLSVKAVSLEAQLDNIAAFSSIMLSALPALAVKITIIGSAFLAKYVILLIYSIITGDPNVLYQIYTTF